MKTIKESNGYKIEFNGKSTYFLSDEHGTCTGYYETERKAVNALNKTLKMAGV